MDNDERPRLGCRLNYVRKLPGMLKLVQLACSFIALILVAVAPTLTYSSRKGFFLFVSIVSLSVTTILLLMALINLQAVFIPERWSLIELCWCVFIALFYFIAGIVVATAVNGNAMFGAVAFFGFAACIAYIVDFINRIRLRRAEEASENTETTVTKTTTTTVTRQQPVY
ncbi:unnamed protein product [Adineta steineri]|uniref:MARVEL domain-containing protein n=1 Tax=Adineta steineri TaxID=433720 RepID=A0A815PAQ0_9BILA|nr:unnamed protein product [Adineta steineri]CAF3690630.1 unnamed protein product [Adineta steineri]